MSLVLVVNAGSSSMKYQLLSPSDGRRAAVGLLERIGEPAGTITHESVLPTGEVVTVEEEHPMGDHAAAFETMIRVLSNTGLPLDQQEVVAVGHRVVQGGSEFVAPTLIDDRVEQRILDLSSLAPLHNPGEHQGIVAARRVFPSIPHVAVFDTAFHQTMPAKAYTYAIDREVAERFKIRRYGFHGTSHAVVSRAAAEFLGRPLDTLKQIVFHLGNGASVCAIDGGQSVNTSMGLTPLEGLVMGSRSGDIDPSILFHLAREGNYGVDDLDALLNTRSGLVGLTGNKDMRDIRAAAEQGDAQAQLALDIVVHRLKHYLGAYLAQLDGADTIIFTAGIGENFAALREEVLSGLEWFGIRIDSERNNSGSTQPRIISADDSRVTALVVPTDEEREIATQTLAAAHG